MRSSIQHPLEMWAGLECSVNRVGDRYFDQFARTRHDQRPGDIDRIVELGVLTIRYPVSWERHVADPSRWRQTDERLTRLRESGIRTIVGLLHHGSGPPDTSLLDRTFPRRLADFAGEVARRYPWIDAYTPINEPLTTARFSSLYGHWYPHARDDDSFARAVVNQVEATSLAMDAIRSRRPEARLIQTEDLGQIHAPLKLDYQAKFENERRWLTWDLLCGTLDDAGPVCSYLREHGVSIRELRRRQRRPCVPDILGVNHYVTSERFLDTRVELYPSLRRGGNGRHAYVDTEAVRCLANGPAGPAALLRQAWNRYRIPIAVTEAHLGCSREEQLRWLQEIWQAAQEVRGEDVNVCAVTAWSIFGAYDWDSLVTRETGSYESGAFDVRSDPPRETALARLIRTLAAGKVSHHPVLQGPGWWRRPERLTVPPVVVPECDGCTLSPQGNKLQAKPLDVPPLLIVGEGSLARQFEAACISRALRFVRLGSLELDACDPAAVAERLAEHGPWAVVNASGFHRVELAEVQPDACNRANVRAPLTVARECRRISIPFVTFSTDLVFDGSLARPYRESDSVLPLSAYGQSHADAERLLKRSYPNVLVIRSGALFGPLEGADFVSRTLMTLRGGNVVALPNDLVMSPSYRPDVVNAALDLLIDGETGVCHLSAAEPMTWAQFIKRFAAIVPFDPQAVQGRSASDLGWKAPRPRFSALTSERVFDLPSVSAHLERLEAVSRNVIA